MHRIPITLVVSALALVTGASAIHAQCGITGTPVINGAPATLCGTGGTSYMWEGPNGFIATTPCVSISSPGEYSLLAFDNTLGMWFGPCLVMVTGDSVIVPPPPPPAPVDSALNCPRPAGYWALACQRAAGERPILSAEQLAAIAAAVDERAQVFGWSDAANGFCYAVRSARQSDLRARALRQFAAVLANLAAGEQHLVSADGRDVHLRDDTMLAMDVARGMSLSDWVASTDAELLSLANASASDRAARRTYQRIRRVGWMVNHGVGVGEVCASGTQDGRESRADDESMAQAFSEDGAASAMMMESAAPMPILDRTRIAFTLAQSDQVELSVVDLSGRIVRTLARGPQSAGRHELTWDGRSDAGQAMPTGAYFVHGRVGAQRVQGRIVMIR